MKSKVVIIICLLLSGQWVNAQSFKIFKGDTINRTDAKGLKQGEWKRFYDNDQLFSISLYKNGKVSGSTKTYYKSGEQQGELVYSKDGKTAYMTGFWPNGKRKATGKYVSQLKDSVWHFYNDKDTLTAIESYKAGKPHGVWKTFFADGRILEEMTYANGKKNGVFKKYYSNGQMKSTGHYKDDTLDGMMVHFYLNGKPLIKGNFENGLKEGEWLYLRESGVKDSSEFYNNGVKQE